MELIIVTTQLSESEFVKVSWHVLINRYIRNAWFIICVPVLFLCSIYEMVWGEDKASSILIFTVWILLFVLPFRMWWLKRSLHENYRTNFRAQEPRRFEFDEQGLVESGTSFRIETTWSRIRQIKRWRNYYLLYVEGGSVHALPNGAFVENNEQQFQQLLDRVKPGWRK